MLIRSSYEVKITKKIWDNRSYKKGSMAPHVEPLIAKILKMRMFLSVLIITFEDVPKFFKDKHDNLYL